MRRGVVVAWGALSVALCLSCAEVIGADEPAVPSLTVLAQAADPIAEGKSLFNQYCSHCHGPNAIQGERPRDLRRLTIRYGPQASEAFWQAVRNGRPDKGMPVWKGTLSDEVLARIFAYLQAVQSTP